MTKNEKILSTLMVVARNKIKSGILNRLTASLRFKRQTHVETISEAIIATASKNPDVIIVDVSDYRSGEFKSKLEPFLLALPRWVKTFLVDSNPSNIRLQEAVQIGSKASKQSEMHQKIRNEFSNQ